jgi:hypothetical protein
MTELEQQNFADYTASLALKDIGFDEGCIAYFEVGSIGKIPYQSGLKFTSLTVFGMETVRNTNEDNDAVSPMFTQVVQWFWNTHKISIEVTIETFEYDDPDIYSYTVFELKENKYGMTSEHIGEEDKMYKAYNKAIIKACQVVKERT